VTREPLNKMTISAAIILVFYVFVLSAMARKEASAGAVGHKKIEGLLRGMILIQGIFVAISMKTGNLPLSFYIVPMFVLILFYIVSKYSAKTFYGS
jgi:hypothetical protein